MCAEFVESPRATCGYGSEIAGWSVVEIDAEIDRLQQNSARIERHFAVKSKSCRRTSLCVVVVRLLRRCRQLRLLIDMPTVEHLLCQQMDKL